MPCGGVNDLTLQEIEKNPNASRSVHGVSEAIALDPARGVLVFKGCQEFVRFTLDGRIAREGAMLNLAQVGRRFFETVAVHGPLDALLFLDRESGDILLATAAENPALFE